MGIMNRRNAVLGWLAWTVGKRVMRQRAKNAAPGIDSGTKRPNRAAIVAALATVGGAVLVWRRLRSGGPSDEGEGEGGAGGGASE
jgi:hypothetical protein